MGILEMLLPRDPMLVTSVVEPIVRAQSIGAPALSRAWPNAFHVFQDYGFQGFARQTIFRSPSVPRLLSQQTV